MPPRTPRVLPRGQEPCLRMRGLMTDLRAFRALRYGRDHDSDLSRVIAPPYDVITPDEQQQLYAQDAHNVVRLELPRAEPTDPPGPEGAAVRHRRAAQTLQEWRQTGVLREDATPALYLYEQHFLLNEHRLVQRSVLGAVRLEPWTAGVVLRHEHTLTG